MEETKVSIIVPIYNVEKYLNRCVESLKNQTYENIEILLIDDGSTDESPKICDELEKQDNRIKTFHKKNGGQGTARNYGLEKSTGEYIMFIDSDDYIEKDTVEKLLQYREYDIVCCAFDRVDEETKKAYSQEMINMPFDELVINDKTIMETAFLSPAVWGKLFKKTLIENIKFSNNKKSIEDILYYLEVIPKVKKIKFVKEILWHYMVRAGSSIMTISEEQADVFQRDLIDVKNNYSKQGYDKYAFDYLTMQVFIHNCISIPSRLYANKDVNIRKRIKDIKKYMNENFKGWKNTKLKIKGRLIKKLAIYTVRLMYKLNIFILFLIMYNFMITKLKVDVKW